MSFLKCIIFICGKLQQEYSWMHKRNATIANFIIDTGESHVLNADEDLHGQEKDITEI